MRQLRVLEVVLGGERFVVKPDRRSMGQRAQVFFPGNEVGQLGEIEDALRERHLELPEDGRIDPRHEVFKILARTIEFERCERTENNASVGGRGRVRTPLIWVGRLDGEKSDGEKLELMGFGEGRSEGLC